MGEILSKRQENDANAQLRIKIAIKHLVQKDNKDNVPHAQLTFLHGTSNFCHYQGLVAGSVIET